MASSISLSNASYTENTAPLLETEKNLSKQKEESPENLRFSSKGPLLTLLIQSIGPLLYNVGNAIHDALDMYLISIALGEHSLQIIGFSSLVRFLLRSFAVYFSLGATAKVPALIAENRKDEASQVITDLFRLTLIAMIIMPIVFVFISKPILIFMGCTQSISEECFSYLIPIIAVSPLTGIYQMSCGFIQSEGRSILNSAMQLSAFVLNCGVFAPILLFVVKVNINLAGLAFALSQIPPGITLFFLIYNRKFNLKPTWKQWGQKFSKETFSALKLASPFILNILAGAFPPMLMMNYMMKAADYAGVMSAVANGFSVFLKIQAFVNSFSQAISQGFLSSGSYSYGAKNRERLFILFGWTICISMTILIGFTPLLILKPELVLSIWMSIDDEISIAKTMVVIPFYTNILNAINDAISNLLLCANFACSALLPSLVRGAFYIIGAVSLYFTDKVDPVRIMYTYNINDLAVLLTDAAISIYPIIVLKRQMKVNQDDDIDDEEQAVSEIKP